MEIENQINNNIKIEKNNFFKNIIGQTINNAIDIGLKKILPDLIENQIIDIKDALLENGIKAGVETAIESVIGLGKSAKGIFTGEFENISQIRTAVGEGGIIDTVSNLLDNAINKIVENGHINNSTARLIKSGKSVILESIEKNIQKELDIQENLLNKLQEAVQKWNTCFKKQDFQGMTEQYNNIVEKLNKTVPLEKILDEAKKVENIHNLIKSNGQNFNITEIEKSLAEKLV